MELSLTLGLYPYDTCSLGEGLSQNGSNVDLGCVGFSYGSQLLARMWFHSLSYFIIEKMDQVQMLVNEGCCAVSPQNLSQWPDFLSS